MIGFSQLLDPEVPMRKISISISLIVLLAVNGFSEGSKEQKAKPPMESYMYTGQLAKGEETLNRYLASNPKDDQARFELGIVTFVRAVERLAQSIYKLGPVTRSQFIPFLTLPVPENKKPESVTYEKFRSLISTFGKDMQRVIDIIDPVKNPSVSVPLFVGRIKLDIDSNKSFSDWETMWVLYSQANRNAGVTRENAESFSVVLDNADVYWLEGYCHLLSALTDALLCYDFKKLFEFAAPYAFARADFDEGDLSDEEYLNDILTLEVIDKQRKRKVAEDILSCFDSSRRCFEAAGLETDDNREWIPNPKQTSVIPGASVSAEMVSYWKMFLSEAESVVLGKKLVPLYMKDVNGTVGVNINRMLMDEKPLDIPAMLKTGTVPWMEKGTLTDYGFWTRLMRVFGGEFIGFAIWFN